MMREGSGAYRAEADAESMARKGGGVSGILDRSGTLEDSSFAIHYPKAIWSSTEIFVKSNTIPLTDPKNGGGLS